MSNGLPYKVNGEQQDFVVYLSVLRLIDRLDRAQLWPIYGWCFTRDFATQAMNKMIHRGPRVEKCNATNITAEATAIAAKTIPLASITFPFDLPFVALQALITGVLPFLCFSCNASEKR